MDGRPRRTKTISTGEMQKKTVFYEQICKLGTIWVHGKHIYFWGEICFFHQRREILSINRHTLDDAFAYF